MKHFIAILLGSVIVKLKLEFNTLMIILYFDSLLSYYAIINQWYSEIETTLYDRYILFWDDCITKRLTLASVRELDYLKLVEWKHNYFLLKDFYPLRHSDVYRISLNHLATRKVLKTFLFSQPWYFGTLWLWKINCKKTWFISRALNYTLYSCCTQFCYQPT